MAPTAGLSGLCVVKRQLKVADARNRHFHLFREQTQQNRVVLLLHTRHTYHTPLTHSEPVLACDGGSSAAHILLAAGFFSSFLSTASRSPLM